MGVRFECPTGHNLHVKAHLAGQRAICPECGARFIVPNFSGARAAEASAADSAAGAPSGHVSVALESSASYDSGLSDIAGADGYDTQESVAWYLRPAAGGQFGPVDASAFGQWVDEGRVAIDSWVWRTGWPDWKPGTEALKAFATAGAGLPQLSPAPRNGRAVAIASASEKPVTSARAAQLRRRKQLNQWLTLGLAVLAVVLLAIVVFVLNRPAETPPAEGDATAPGAGATP